MAEKDRGRLQNTVSGEDPRTEKPCFRGTLMWAMKSLRKMTEELERETEDQGVDH